MVLDISFKKRDANAIVFLILILWVMIVMNVPSYLIEKPVLIYRISDSVLMLLGLLGSVYKIGFLRVMGWVGIVLFMPAILWATPDLDHAAPELRGFPTLWRLATTLLLFLMLVFFFKRLKEFR